MLEEKIGKKLNVEPENVTILAADENGNVKAKVMVVDNYVITVYADKSGENIELKEEEVSGKIGDFAEESQNNKVTMGAVWSCWFPNCASCI